MILRLYKVRKQTDPQADVLLRQLRGLGYSLTSLRIEKVLRLEGDDEQLERLGILFAHPILEAVGRESVFSGTDPVREICYKRAITDPELDSVRHAAKALGVNSLEWARLSTRYELSGVDEMTADEIVVRHLYNKTVETILLLGEEWETLIPQGEAGGVEMLNLPDMDADTLTELSERRRLMLSDRQMEAIREFYVREGRGARDAELEMLAAAWSDHCFHTSWKALGLLRALQEATARINHTLVLSAYEDNSGVMEFYEGWAINVKGETHISPTFGGSPYGGIMTKHGGVIRDIIFTGQGAWPIVGTTIMGTVDPRIPWDKVPKGAFHPLVVLRESIRGTKDYTNPMGIPMGWSQYLEHPRNWKGLALGHSVGIIPADRSAKGKPLPGDFVVLIGGPTGIDGVHGATVSSGKMTHETVVRDATHVQIGMPIEERKFMEAIPVLRDADCIRAGTDCGAAGLASAVGEMGAACGVWVNLSWVSLKCVAIKHWEIWLSESQERGVLAVPTDKLGLAREILASYNVPAVVIGVFTDTRRCQVVWKPDVDQEPWLTCPAVDLDGEIVVDLPYDFLEGDCPLPEIVVRQPAIDPVSSHIALPATQGEWEELIRRHLGHYNICDQSVAAHQYDQTVQGKTAVTYLAGSGEQMPEEVFVSTPLRRRPYAVGIANAVNQYYGDIDPDGLGRLMMAQAAAKLVAAGFSPADITCCANVYTPRITDSPENAWSLKTLVHAYSVASEELGIPVISGKDSSSGTFEDRGRGLRIDAPLTLDILTVGRMPNVEKIPPKEFQAPGDTIILYHPGLRKITLDGSVLADLLDVRGHELPDVSLPDLRRGLEAYHELLWVEQVVRSRSAVSEGGVIRRLFEMSLGSSLGCSVEVPADPLLWLFGELHGAIVFSTDRKRLESFLPGDCLVLGEVIPDPIIKIVSEGRLLVNCPIADLASEWARTFKEVVL